MQKSYDDIFSIKSETDFSEAALKTFKVQALKVPVYKDFLEYLRIDPDKVKSIHEIPFLPVELFKYHTILHGDHTAGTRFLSSGTAGSISSQHFVADEILYQKSILNAFTLFYGSPQDFCFLALLPSYLERSGSSLVYMADFLIRESGHPQSGFYLYNYESLIQTIDSLKHTNQKTVLLGVSFALLELAEKYSPDLSGAIVMETGGMKGRRKELIREELHDILKEKFHVSTVHSEYGMTELLSQAYSYSEGLFHSPPWMKILIRDPYDPMNYLKEGLSGAVNIIDLANRYSCSFIATSDLGRITRGKGFEILGRMDSSDLRGCNLLVA